MALFDRNENRGYDRDMNRGRGGGFLDRVQNAFRGQDAHTDDHLRRDAGTGYGGGMNRGWNAGGYNNQPMDREGGLHQRNSWSDGAWTADAGERADREWNVGNRSGRNDYDRDMSPFQAGWRAGGMSGGNLSGGMDMNRGMSGGGMGMNRGMDNERGWNLGTGDRDWGHTGNLGGNVSRGYAAGGMDRDWSDRGAPNRGGGFMDRAQNAIRRGWDQVEDRFDRDDHDRNNMHMGGSSMRGGTSWAGQYDRDWHGASDVRGYRDADGNYGTTHTGGMMGGAGMSGGMSGGMNRYGSDYDRGGMMGRGGYDRGDYDRGYKTRQQTDAGDPFGDRQSQTPFRVTGGSMGNRGSLNRYDSGYDRNGRDWF